MATNKKKLTDLRKYFGELGGEAVEEDDEFPFSEKFRGVSWKLLGMISNKRITELPFLKIVTLLRERTNDPAMVLRLKKSAKRDYFGVYIQVKEL